MSEAESVQDAVHEVDQIIELLTSMIETIHIADHIVNTVLSNVDELDDARLALDLVRYAKNRADMFRILADLKGTDVVAEMEHAFGSPIIA